jgi:hypothetical protein
MRAKPVQINWHEKAPIFSADIAYINGNMKVATAGGEGGIRVSKSSINRNVETA